MNNQQLLKPDTFYHIYNRSNGKDNLFIQEENYSYFLKKYDFYLSDFVSTYAYCLLPGHFHLLVHTSKDIQSDEIISEQFRKLFISYSKSINKRMDRHGSLFQKNFKRKIIETEKYFIRVVFYIHSNPQHHGITKDFKTYPYSSYSRFLKDRKSKLQKEEVFKWFNGKDEFIKFHNEININSVFGRDIPFLEEMECLKKEWF